MSLLFIRLKMFIFKYIYNLLIYCLQSVSEVIKYNTTIIV